MPAYREYHYHSIIKLIVMSFLSLGTYGAYYWYRLWRGQFNQPTMSDRRTSLSRAALYYFYAHGLLVALSERLKNTDPRLALQGFKSPKVMTGLIAGSSLLLIALIVKVSLAAPGSYALLVLWLGFAAISAFFMVSLQTNINQAYLIEHQKKPSMSKRGYIWYGIFIALFLIQDATFFVTPTEQKYQNIDTDYSGKLPSELMDY